MLNDRLKPRFSSLFASYPRWTIGLRIFHPFAPRANVDSRAHLTYLRSLCSPPVSPRSRSFTRTHARFARRYLVVYFAGDLALYLGVKVARGDFHYWLPVDGAFGLLLSLLARVLVKTITDFTGVIQFRGDPELGGLYWTVNMVLALLASFGSVFVYYAEGREGTFEIEERVAWALVGSLSGAWLAVFGVFLMLMKKGYRRTFFTTRTGKQWTMDFFLKGTDDSVKKGTVAHNKKQWLAIREDVKEWVQANWWRWKEEKPEWFSLVWQSKVPKEWIEDVEERARLDELREKGARRSSAEKVRGLFGKGKGKVYAEGGGGGD